MKKFIFPLQALLNQKIHLEEEALLKLAKAQHELEIRLQNKSNFEQELIELKKAKSPLFSQRISGDQYMGFVRYSILIQNRIVDAKNKIDDQNVILDARRNVLLEKTKEKKALEILKEKQRSKWKKEFNHYYTKISDDLTQQRYIRNQT